LAREKYPERLTQVEKEWVRALTTVRWLAAYDSHNGQDQTEQAKN